MRTAVFLKGCPLRCAWCHNPESQRLQPETGASGKVYGRSMSVDEVMHAVLADRPFYEASGGGLTLSGGEPTVQFDFCKALLQAAKNAGIHTCLDTCGQVPTARLEELLPWVDLFHYDWKLDDAEAHRTWTGADHALVRKNLHRLLAAGARVILRCPIIPGVNDTPEHAAVLAQWEAHSGIESVERLPYHTTGESKYSDLNRPSPCFPI
ncbi:MAG: glycyl-radical enzyme activating protein [Puniceicoccaceae bacterium]